MKTAIGALLICFTTLTAVAAKHPDFSGTCVLNPEKSKNIGMMSQSSYTGLQ